MVFFEQPCIYTMMSSTRLHKIKLIHREVKLPTSWVSAIPRRIKDPGQHLLLSLLNLIMFLVALHYGRLCLVMAMSEGVNSICTDPAFCIVSWQSNSFCIDAVNYMFVWSKRILYRAVPRQIFESVFVEFVWKESFLDILFCSFCDFLFFYHSIFSIYVCIRVHFRTKTNELYHRLPG